MQWGCSSLDVWNNNKSGPLALLLYLRLGLFFLFRFSWLVHVDPLAFFLSNGVGRRGRREHSLLLNLFRLFDHLLCLFLSHFSHLFLLLRNFFRSDVPFLISFALCNLFSRFTLVVIQIGQILKNVLSFLSDSQRRELDLLFLSCFGSGLFGINRGCSHVFALDKRSKGRRLLLILLLHGLILGPLVHKAPLGVGVFHSVGRVDLALQLQLLLLLHLRQTHPTSFSVNRACARASTFSLKLSFTRPLNSYMS